MKIILGPCRCQGCRLLVFYSGKRWCDPSGKVHDCGGRMSRTATITAEINQGLADAGRLARPSRAVGP